MRSIAPTVVAVHVENDEATVRVRDRIGQLGDHRIELAMHVTRSFNQRIVGRVPPYFQSPALPWIPIYRLAFRPVQIDLEPRAMHDHMGGDIEYGLAGVRIFLAQTVFAGQGDGALDVRAQIRAVVDGRGDQAIVAALHAPPGFAVFADGSREHRRDRASGVG